MRGPGHRGGPMGHHGHRGGFYGGPRGFHGGRHMPPHRHHHHGYYGGGCLGCCMYLVGMVALIGVLLAMIIL